MVKRPLPVWNRRFTATLFRVWEPEGYKKVSRRTSEKTKERKGKREGKESICLICSVMFRWELTSFEKRQQNEEWRRIEEARGERGVLASSIGINYVGCHRCQQPDYQISIEYRSPVSITSTSQTRARYTNPLSPIFSDSPRFVIFIDPFENHTSTESILNWCVKLTSSGIYIRLLKIDIARINYCY